jgi:hypothetical protein
MLIYLYLFYNFFFINVFPFHVPHTGARCVRKKTKQKKLYNTIYNVLYSWVFFPDAPSPCGPTVIFTTSGIIYFHTLKYIVSRGQLAKTIQCLWTCCLLKYVPLNTNGKVSIKSLWGLFTLDGTLEGDCSILRDQTQTVKILHDLIICKRSLTGK